MKFGGIVTAEQAGSPRKFSKGSIAKKKMNAATKEPQDYRPENVHYGVRRPG
jgi:hypothetical protein